MHEEEEKPSPLNLDRRILMATPNNPINQPRASFLSSPLFEFLPLFILSGLIIFSERTCAKQLCIFFWLNILHEKVHE